MSPVLRKRLRILSIVFLVLTVILFSLRGLLLDIALEKVNDRLRAEFGIGLFVKDDGFSGLSTVWITGLVLLPSSGDTLVQIDTLSFRPDWFSLFKVRPGIGYLFIHKGGLLLNTSSIGNNISFLNKRHTADHPGSKSESRDYARFMGRFLDQAFSLAPQEAEINSMSIRVATDTFQASIRISDFISDKDSVRGVFEEPLADRKWHIEGAFNQHAKSFSVDVHPTIGDGRLPLIGGLLGGTVGYDKLKVSLSGVEFSNGLLALKGGIATEGLVAYHPRIASDTIRVSKLSFDYAVTVGKEFVELDSASTVRVDQMAIRPFFRMDRDKGKAFKAAIAVEPMPADDFFHSLPSGMFGDVRSIRADGVLAFRMDFELDDTRLDSVRFHCSMRKEGFKVRDYGTSGLFKLNSEFVHDVYEKDRFVRSFPVGPSYPSFTPLAEVSPYFKNAVLTSEDGNFYFHNGFNEDAFRKSIADNYRAGKFVRGGSTITMQLVKNVFLTRKKTVARKAEEALLVWLIESGHLVSKDRMLEVYFNIIELGPGVYGVSEAARFYFDKRPMELSLGESIFLASLLPRPKAFRSCFDSTAHLKPYMADYFRVMTNFMVKKNLVLPEEAAAVIPDVRLIGPAASMLLRADSTQY